MREVSRDEFFAEIGPLDVHPIIVTSTYPYTQEWRMHKEPCRRLAGRTTGRIERGVCVTTYELADLR